MPHGDVLLLTRLWQTELLLPRRSFTRQLKPSTPRKVLDSALDLRVMAETLVGNGGRCDLSPRRWWGGKGGGSFLVARSWEEPGSFLFRRLESKIFHFALLGRLSKDFNLNESLVHMFGHLIFY